MTRIELAKNLLADDSKLDEEELASRKKILEHDSLIDVPW